MSVGNAPSAHMADLPGGPTSKSKECRDKNGSKKIQQQNNPNPNPNPNKQE